jgi:hypothetical protein
MKRGMPPGGVNPNPSIFPVPDDAACDASEPEPEAVPERIQHMMAAMAVQPAAGGGAVSRTPSPPVAAAPGAGAHEPAWQTRAATTTPGGSMAGYVVREKKGSPAPGPRTSFPNQMSMYKASQ